MQSNLDVALPAQATRVASEARESPRQWGMHPPLLGSTESH